MLALLIAVIVVPLAVAGALFALALARVAAKPTPPVYGPVGEDHDA